MPSQTITGTLYVDVTPPIAGVDPAPRVHADLGSTAIPVTVNTAGAANLNTIGGVAVGGVAQLLIPARATRRSCIVSNLDNTNYVFVGNAGVTPGTGKSIAPGQSLTLPVTGAVYVVAVAGTPTVDAAEAYD